MVNELECKMKDNENYQWVLKPNELSDKNEELMISYKKYRNSAEGVRMRDVVCEER